MGVNLCRGNVCVAEHDLHRPQVRSVFEQVACKGMPQGVRGDLLSDSGEPGAPLEDLPEGLPAHGFCPRRHKQMGRTPLLEQARTAVRKVVLEGLLRLCPHGHHPLLGPLAERSHPARLRLTLTILSPTSSETLRPEA